MSPLILLHGALGAAPSMDVFAQALKSVKFYIINLSGHGTENWPNDRFSIETFETDVLRFMDSQNIPAAHIFGYSMGGFVALRLAAKAPERILSVTTLATKMDWTEESCQKESAMLNADVMEAKVPKFVAALDALHPQAGWRKIVEHTQYLIHIMHRYRFSDEDLGQIKQPIRMMVGDRDKMVSIDETIAVYRALPNGSLCVLPHTPHPLEGVDNTLVASLIQQAISQAGA